MIYLQLWLSFLKVGLFSIGGGYVAIPLIQSEVVTRYAWLSVNEFTDLVTIAEMTPGPITVNAATFVGTRIAGTPGAIAATFGCIMPSCIIVSLLAFLYFKYKNLSLIQSVLHCLRPGIIALITAAGISIFRTAVFAGKSINISHIQWISLVLFLAAFVVLRKWKLNPILVMSTCGVVCLIYSYIII